MYSKRKSYFNLLFHNMCTPFDNAFKIKNVVKIKIKIRLKTQKNRAVNKNIKKRFYTNGAKVTTMDDAVRRLSSVHTTRIHGHGRHFGRPGTARRHGP